MINGEIILIIYPLSSHCLFFDIFFLLFFLFSIQTIFAESSRVTRKIAYVKCLDQLLQALDQTSCTPGTMRIIIHILLKIVSVPELNASVIK